MSHTVNIQGPQHDQFSYTTKHAVRLFRAIEAPHPIQIHPLVAPQCTAEEESDHLDSSTLGVLPMQSQAPASGDTQTLSDSNLSTSQYLFVSKSQVEVPPLPAPELPDRQPHTNDVQHSGLLDGQMSHFVVQTSPDTSTGSTLNTGSRITDIVTRQKSVSAIGQNELKAAQCTVQDEGDARKAKVDDDSATPWPQPIPISHTTDVTSQDSIRAVEVGSQSQRNMCRRCWGMAAAVEYSRIAAERCRLSRVWGPTLPKAGLIMCEKHRDQYMKQHHKN